MKQFTNFDLAQWLEHIQAQHWRTIEMKLDRITAVWQKLGQPQAPFIITVAGTNGKGSCVAMLESVLRAAGKTTGSYTSPHLVRYNERICIDGVEASDTQIIGAFCEIEAARGDVPLTYFEYSTLCALVVFHHAGVEVCLMETGMGGRLDAVNMLDNNIALVTSVGLDHEQWLGDTREKIAVEKAGVFKQDGLAVCAEPMPPSGIADGANRVNATLLQIGSDFEITGEKQYGLYHYVSDHDLMSPEWRSIAGISTSLSGVHQSRNVAGVITVLGLTATQTGVTPDHLVQGLTQSKLPARCEVIARRPLTILDVAHNADSAKELGVFLRANQSGGETYAVFGVLEDKVLEPIVLEVSGQIDQWYLASLEGERGQTAKTLRSKLLKFLPEAKVSIYSSPADAFQAANAHCQPEDRLLAFGSFFTVGDILSYLERPEH